MYPLGSTLFGNSFEEAFQKANEKYPEADSIIISKQPQRVLQQTIQESLTQVRSH